MLKVSKKLIGQILVEKGLISEEKLKYALDFQKSKAPNKRIGEILIELGYINDEDLAKALAESLNLQYTDIKNTDIDETLLNNIPLEIIKHYKILPIRKDQFGIILLGMVNPLDTEALNVAREYLNTINVDISVISNSGFERIFNDLENRQIVDQALKEIKTETIESAEELVKSINLDQTESQSGIVKLVEAIFKQAITYRATDIHIEPTRQNVKVRYRIDGVLYKGLEFPIEKLSEVVSRIKIIAQLNITESRLPQEGHLSIKTRNSEYDLRISTLPSRYGEKVVVRILDKKQTILDIEKLGFTQENIQKVKLMISKPYGFIVVSGPTGAGKTTTLFSILKELDIESKNIITVEDPIEYELENITQVQINEKIGLTFENCLKHILRQDPDVILVGEIRDEETLRISIQASLTGHLVLTTIHANDAISTIIRMKEMNINPEYLFSSLIGIINQRLVRVLCNNCKKKKVKNTEELLNLITRGNNDEIELIGNTSIEIVYEPVGCPICNWTGYLGRTSISETIIFNNSLKDLIIQNIPAYRIKKILSKEQNQKFLINDAIQKVKLGITSIEEIQRVI
ncbi:MAG: ATPase, T2SS/T4P/T4SS family [Candidatus Calescibacterium sp.]|nr:ATPase, T2SS/T4P/T4SS family [Candidatus Calescibacterium sp.]MCX7971601.1 ATPase, T2SS/T4P/T4SS family [bacterium]MDW8195809.1 ATPase, T2SS/T4P/T4SS family [Candidatus Calescibacterium sp.]